MVEPKDLPGSANNAFDKLSEDSVCLVFAGVKAIMQNWQVASNHKANIHQGRGVQATPRQQVESENWQMSTAQSNRHTMS